MKRKIYGIAIVLTFAIAGVIGANSNLLNSYMNLNLLMENVEALAALGESGGQEHECYDNYKETGKDGTSENVRICNGCTHKRVFKPSKTTICNGN